MTGGAFKNSSNLLARKREIEELEQKVDSIRKELSELKNRREDIRTAIELNADELDQVKEELQQKYLVQNTAKMNVDRAKQQRNESEAVFTGLMGEKQQIEQQIEEIDNNKKQILDEIEYSKKREQEINEEANFRGAGEA